MGTAEQLAAATAAAFGPHYRAPDGMLYADTDEDWFHPIGFTKPRPITAQPIEHRGNEMSIATTVEKVKSAVGLGDIDQTKVERFKELQAIIAKKDEAEADRHEANAELVAARQAQAEGRAEYNGFRIEYAVQQADWRTVNAASKCAKIQAAEAEIIGLCPSESLQRERRRICEQRKRICKAIAETKQQIHDAEKSRLSAVRRVAAREGGQDRRQLEVERRELARVDRDLAELREDLQLLIVDREESTTEKEALYQQMRAFEV